ncbi:hypothetical protein L208DRAFT_1231334 [Tricholoma matsutake]|nr:hypothetical protein L208DRAFT_1231334 [Tricholoma matsutake 945]
MNLNSISQNASRLGMRLQESFSEHTRDFTLPRTSYLDAQDDKGKDIRRQLDSSSDREKIDAMKRLVALISKGRNVSEYFAQVVKNVAAPNLEIRKLVYIYLLRYAEQEPDLALLSINTFQKDLTDSNPLIRAMALRVLSGIKVPMIGNIVVLAIKKCAADISPYVRKTAALAIPKCYELDNAHLPALINIITTLLRDHSPLSLGSVAVAFEDVCPTRLDLLHQHYRRLCKTLVDVDEWGQVDLANLLLRYARTMLPRPGAIDEDMDKDVKLLLASVEPLFQSRNPAVVLAVTRVFYYAGTPSYLPKIVHPLLRLLSVSKEVERIVLVYILLISRSSPNFFAPFYTRFLVRTDDLRQVKQDKIKLLLNIITIDTYPAILRELIDYADDPDDTVVSDAIRGMGRCASLIPECTQQCLTALIAMIKSGHDTIISSAVLVLKYLVQFQLHRDLSAASTSQSPMSIISHLARRIDDIRHAQGRACVLWLVGQYADGGGGGSARGNVAEWAPDVLRKGAKGFMHEVPVVKLQITTLAAKLLVLSPTDSTLLLLAQYVFSLARYDKDYDVRDRARMLSSLLAGVVPGLFLPVKSTNSIRPGVVLRREQVKLVLFEGKSEVADVEDSQGHKQDETLMLGTLSLITGRPMSMDNVLPDWHEKGVESTLRDTEEEGIPVPAPVPQPIMGNKAVVVPVVLTPSGGSSPVGSHGRGGGSGSKGAWKDLDKFYADTEEDEDGGEDEDEEESEEESEDEDEDEDEAGEEHSASGEELEDSKEEHDSEEENHTVEQTFAAGAHLELL